MSGIVLLIIFELPRSKSYWPSFLLKYSSYGYTTGICNYFKRIIKIQQLQNGSTSENSLQLLKALLLFLAPNYLCILLQQLGYGCCYLCASYHVYTILACDSQKSSDFLDILGLSPIYYILNFGQIDYEAFLGYYEAHVFHVFCKEGALAHLCIELVLSQDGKHLSDMALMFILIL